MNPVIELSHVYKTFPWTSLRPKTLKEAVIRCFKPAGPTEKRTFEALKDVSLQVYKGQTVGVIGTNGSGKSTVLKLITGIIRPNSGSVSVVGRLSALLELGAGFHPDFSGRENVFLNGAILGLKRRELEASFDKIVEFAEIGDFIDQPVKTYSSGMYMRLAFAIAVNIDPDILVVDEILAVGDWAFQQKCYEKIRQFREAGKTILLVTHDHTAVKSLCDRAIWIERGVKRLDGPAEEVVDAYVASQQSPEPVHDLPDVPIPPVSIESLGLYTAAGNPCAAITADAPARIHVAWKALEDLSVSWVLSYRRVSDGALAAGSVSPPQFLPAGTQGVSCFAPTLLDLMAGRYQIAVEAWVGGKPVAGTLRTYETVLESAWNGPGAYQVPGGWTELHHHSDLSIAP